MTIPRLLNTYLTPYQLVNKLSKMPHFKMAWARSKHWSTYHKYWLMLKLRNLFFIRRKSNTNSWTRLIIIQFHSCQVFLIKVWEANKHWLYLLIYHLISIKISLCILNELRFTHKLNYFYIWKAIFGQIITLSGQLPVIKSLSLKLIFKK